MANVPETNWVDRFDDVVDRKFELVRGNRITDRVFYFLSEAANHSLLWHALNWTFALFSSRPDRTKSALRISGILIIESLAVNGPIKQMFRRSRPVEQQERPHKLRKPKTSSFPSGHATSAFCAAALLSRNSRKAKPVVYVGAAMVASSRIYVKIHHASDVVAGACLGAAVGRLAKRLID